MRALLLVAASAAWFCTGCQSSTEPVAEENTASGALAENSVAGERADSSVLVAAQAPESVPTRAICVLRPVGDSKVSGVVHFERQKDKVEVWGTVHNLKPGEHGFHIHEFGDLTDQQKGKSAGEHFNPHDQPHGRPDASERHVGDFGNIEANESGTAEFRFTDAVISFHGPTSILGRAVVVHEQPDDFTQPSGGAGDRVAFGVIGVAQADKPRDAT